MFSIGGFCFSGESHVYVVVICNLCLCFSPLRCVAHNETVKLPSQSERSRKEGKREAAIRGNGQSLNAAVSGSCGSVSPVYEQTSL